MEDPVVCQLCEEALEDNEPHGFHRECGLREVLGGIGHNIAHDYWCLHKHDPDAGYTYRQSAQMVYAIFHVNPGLLLEDPALTATRSSTDDLRPR